MAILITQAMYIPKRKDDSFGIYEENEVKS